MADDTDKTDEIRERVEDDGVVGGETDSDSGAVFTIDSDSSSGDGEGEGTADNSRTDGGR